MWTKVASYLAVLFTKYVLPYLMDEANDLIAAWYANWVNKRADKKVDKAAEEKFNQDFHKPGATPREKANAIRDLINAGSISN